MKKVLLLSMPFGALERQALGISMLKSKLNEIRIDCDLAYFTFDFAEQIGIDNYTWINHDLPYTAFAGDWLFTEALYGFRPDEDRAYIQEVLQKTWNLSNDIINKLLDIRSATSTFLSHVLESVEWNDYAVIGFTSTFEQNIASLALAKYIKQQFPDKTIFFGGANWEKEMGTELLQQFTFVDYACSGEADDSFPRIMKLLLKPKESTDTLESIPGIIYRKNGVAQISCPPTIKLEMDELPIPDYSDYFLKFEKQQATKLISPMLLIETSRGCWWGAKHHCTFCGLNGNGMAFRSKSVPRVLNELKTLSEKWDITFFEVVDNILDMTYFRELIPKLAKKNYKFFYEVKANLRREHIEAFSKAGIDRIQPGIESMNNHILKLMRKGTTFLQNILLLRLCKEYNITVDWNVLYGFPGETREDYEEMLALFPFIRHLNAPHACGPIRLDRFSPYHSNPEQFGMKNLKPFAPYKYLYPFGEESNQKIAYYFEFEYFKDIDPAGFADPVITYVQQWQEYPERGELIVHFSEDDVLEIVDTRSNACVHQLQLSGIDSLIYQYCDNIRSVSQVVAFISRTESDFVCSKEQVIDYLDSMVDNLLMVKDGDKYLSLATGLKKKEINYTPEMAVTAESIS